MAPRPPVRTRAGVRRTLVTGLLALALGAAACGADDATEPGDAASGPPRQGGRMTMLTIADSVSLDPFATSYSGAPADSPRMAALYDPMVYLDPASGKVVPHLAEALTSADGGATWTLRLRPEVRFSDGTPFDAEAVKVNWETHADPGIRSLHRGAATGLALRVVDPLTLHITPPSPNANFDRLVAVELTFIEAPSVLAKGPEVYRNHPVGAGPFTLKSWTPGSEQVFVRNETYWQKDKGLPHLDSLVLKPMPDTEQQYNTLKSGGADLFVSVDDKLLERAAKELNSRVTGGAGGQVVQFNLTRPPFDDVRARRALALALDPADLSKTLNNGYVPAKGFFNEDSPFFAADATQPAPDKAEAQRLLDELAAEGRPLEFSYVVPMSPVSLKVAEYMQSRLQTLRNVTMKIDSLDVGAYITKAVVQRDYQAMLYSEWITDPEPRMYNAFHSGSAQNATGWNNPGADRALETGRSSTDPAARAQAYRELQRALATDLPVWAYAEAAQGPIFTDRVTGVQQYNSGSVLMDRIGLTR